MPGNCRKDRMNKHITPLQLGKAREDFFFCHFIFKPTKCIFFFRKPDVYTQMLVTKWNICFGQVHSPVRDACRSIGAGEAHSDISPNCSLQKPMLRPRDSTATSSFFHYWVFLKIHLWQGPAAQLRGDSLLLSALLCSSQPEQCLPPAPAEDRRPFLVNLGSPLQLY